MPPKAAPQNIQPADNQPPRPKAQPAKAVAAPQIAPAAKAQPKQPAPAAAAPAAAQPVARVQPQPWGAADERELKRRLETPGAHIPAGMACPMAYQPLLCHDVDELLEMEAAIEAGAAVMPDIARLTYFFVRQLPPGRRGGRIPERQDARRMLGWCGEPCDRLHECTDFGPQGPRPVLPTGLRRPTARPHEP